LNAAKKYWKNTAGKDIIMFSTDEVFGALGSTGFFYRRNKI
jgi:dTDP-D-glucose 4,6-dehydratase